MDIGSIHFMPRGNLLLGCDGHPAQMQGRNGNSGLHPGEIKRDKLRLRRAKEDNGANPVREPEVSAPTAGHANWNSQALLLHYSGTFSNGFQPPTARGHDLPN